MELQVKERIVGATVLVALGVLIIPWVLDGRDEPAEEPIVDEPLILPAAEESIAPIRTETVELEPSTPRPRLATSEAVADERETEAGTRPPEALTENQNVASALETPADDADTETASLPDTRDRVAATTDPAPSPRADAGIPEDRSSWTVQLGAFSELANANQLVERVLTYGFDASVSEVVSAGQTLHRVRVGGFETENQAVAAASSLSAHGFRSRVIPPEE